MSKAKPRQGFKPRSKPQGPPPALSFSTKLPPREPVVIDGTRYELRWRSELDPRHVLRAETLAPRVRAIAGAMERGVDVTPGQLAEFVGSCRELAGYILTAPAAVVAKLTDTQILQVVAKYGYLALEGKG